MLPGAVVPIAETTRSGVVESIHFGAVVALDADGMTPGRPATRDIDVYPRSALKPLQAQAMVDAGFAAEPDELAVAARQPQRRADPPRRRPADPGQRRPRRGRPRQHAGAAARASRAPRTCCGPAGGRAPLLQNCSGKHAAMLSTCVANGWDDRQLPRVRPPGAEADRRLHRRGGRRGQPHRRRRLRCTDGDGHARSGWRSPCGRWRSAGRRCTWRCASIPHLVAGTGREDTAADARRAGPGRQGRRRGGPRRRPSRRSGRRREGRRRVRTGSSAGDAGGVALARVRRRRRARAADPRPRPPGRRGPSLVGGPISSVGGSSPMRSNFGGRRWRYDCTPSWKSPRPKLSTISRSASAPASPSPRWRSRYTCRLITAIDVGEQCSARLTR